MPTDWISKVKVKPGALHRQLGYDQQKPIPTSVLQQVKQATVGTQVHQHTVTPLMKRRANFALNMRKK